MQTSIWDLLNDDLQDKIIQLRNDMIQFSPGLFCLEDHLFGNCHILIQSISMFHVFYLEFNTLEKKRLRKCYDFNGNQYISYPLDFKHKIKLYPYMLDRL